MTNNVIQFQSRKVETIEIKDATEVEIDANDFANEIVEMVHDVLHERTGECMFTDDEYTSITICISEVITALYMKSQGHGHPFLEIAEEIFGEDVDIADEMSYTDVNINDEDE
jgi:hypothetical protein